MVVGCGDVCFAHKFFAPSSDAVRDHLFRKIAHVGKHQNVEVEESTCDYPALPQRILGCFSTFLHIFYASAGAILVVIELMECPEIATEAKPPLVRI